MFLAVIFSIVHINCLDFHVLQALDPRHLQSRMYSLTQHLTPVMGAKRHLDPVHWWKHLRTCIGMLTACFAVSAEWASPMAPPATWKRGIPTARETTSSEQHYIACIYSSYCALVKDTMEVTVIQVLSLHFMLYCLVLYSLCLVST